MGELMSKYDMIAERVAKNLRADTKGTVELYGLSAICRKQIGETGIDDFAATCRMIANEFLKDLRAAIDEATLSAVDTRDITSAGISVRAFRNIPGVEVYTGIGAVPRERWENVLMAMKKRGYRIR
jgi:hypothetical protein